MAEINLEARISSASFNVDATKVLATTGESVVRIFDLHSPEETQKLAVDLKLEPLSDSERRLLLF